jgi:hypothetical protein
MTQRNSDCSTYSRQGPAPGDNTGPVTDTAAAYHRQRLADGEACRLAAFDYLARGWSALSLCGPDHFGIGRTYGRKCKSPGKAPWGDWAEFQTRLPTAAELGRKWADNPTLNVGMALGRGSRAVRADLEGPQALSRLRELCGGEPPPTPAFASGRADGTGLGLLFSIPPNLELRTRREGLPLGGELRLMGEGSQSVLPPSRHKSGGLYRWLPGHGPGEVALAPAPPWMLELLAPRPESARETAAGRSESDPEAAGGDRDAALQALAHLKAGRADPYDSWLQVGMALHSVSDDLLEAWDEWSKASTKHQPGACKAKWATFTRDRDSRVGIGTLVHLARLDGWVWPQPLCKIVLNGRPRGGAARKPRGRRVHVTRFTVRLEARR